MERFVTIVNGVQPLTIITKRSILDVAAVPDAPVINQVSHPAYEIELKTVSETSYKWISRDKLKTPPQDLDILELILSSKRDKLKSRLVVLMIHLMIQIKMGRLMLIVEEKVFTI